MRTTQSRTMLWLNLFGGSHPKGWHEEYGEDVGVDGRGMRDDPVRKIDTVTEDDGGQSEKGEEEGKPVVGVSEQEMVDVDPVLCSQNDGHQEHHNECHHRFDLDHGRFDAGDTAGVAEQGGDRDDREKDEVEVGSKTQLKRENYLFGGSHPKGWFLRSE